jgi:outer membrane protein
MNTLRKLFGVAIIASLSLAASAQLKIGHVNSQELLSLMPEADSAQKKVEKLSQDHQMLLEEMTVEFNKKLDDYQKKLDDQANPMSPLVKSSKEAELQDLQNRVQLFEQQASQELQQKKMELFQPIQEKAMKAINDVATENGFTYILDSGVGVILYSAPNSEDILPLVKKKLGLQ